MSISFSIADILNTTRDPDTNIVSVKVGELLTGDVLSESAITGFGPYGFVSAPPLPSAISDLNAAVQALTLTDPSGTYVLGTRSARDAKLAGKLKPSETMMYGPKGLKLIMKETGVATLVAETPDGKLVSLSIGPEGLAFQSPWATFYIDNEGIRLNHGSGAGLDLGGFSGAEGPLKALIGSMATLQADVVNVEGGVTQLGISASGTFIPAVVTAPLANGAIVPVGASLCSSVYVTTGA